MRRLLLILGLAASFILGTTSVALAAALDNETLHWAGVFSANFTCSPQPPTTTPPNQIGYYMATGLDAVATGPYAGTFTETGTITFNSAGRVTGWTAHFMIFDASFTKVVEGDKTMLTGGLGTCSNGSLPTPGGGIVLTEAGNATATMTYSATITGSPPNTPPDTGTVTAALVFTQVGDTVTGSSLTEHFGPLVPVVQPGCNTSGNGNGNDSCSQNGNN